MQPYRVAAASVEAASWLRKSDCWEWRVHPRGPMRNACAFALWLTRSILAQLRWQWCCPLLMYQFGMQCFLCSHWSVLCLIGTSTLNLDATVLLPTGTVLLSFKGHSTRCTSCCARDHSSQMQAATHRLNTSAAAAALLAAIDLLRRCWRRLL